MPDPNRGGPAGSRPVPSRSGRLLAVLAVVAVVTCTAAVGSGPPGPGRAPAGVAEPAPVAATTTCGPAWVTGWMAAPHAAPRVAALDGATLRMVVHPQVTGTQVRVRLSNAYGTAPLTVGAVSAGRSDGPGGVVPATLTRVLFAGRGTVVVPAGGDVVSDPVPVLAEAGRALAVSMFLPVAPSVTTGHAVALQTSYLSRRGDHTLVPGSAPFATPTGAWFVLTGVDVLAPRPVHAVVAVGDSITDGVGSAPDTDQRWSDALSGALADTGGSASMAVLNAGIAGNRLVDGDPRRSGDTPLTRFDRDVGALAGATDVVLHIGTNDIAAGRDAEEVVAGLQRFAARAHAAGKRVFLSTITPADRGPHGTAVAIRTRDEVNAWIRSRGRDHADGVFDFAAAVSDPPTPSRLDPAYDSGDGLHLSAAGYRALAGAVDTAALTGSPCLADGDARIRVVASGRR